MPMQQCTFDSCKGLLMLGDKLERALKRIGVDSQKVSNWVGKPCGCEERREKLNQLHAWALRTLRGTVDDAEVYLHRILEEEEEDE